jgi:general secretion pathway protein D
MTDRRHFPARLPLSRIAVLLPLLWALAAPSWALAQRNAAASQDPRPPSARGGAPASIPDFIPPPPPRSAPSTPPPSRVPTMQVEQGQAEDAQDAEAGATAAADTFTEEELLERPSQIVEDEDPAMQEVVGLIRIPEMGTNEVLEMLENFTRKPILRQQSLPAVKITFFSQGPLTRGEAITAIESLLSLNGIAITTLGEKFLKAVPSAVINAQVPRVWEGTTLNATPSQMIYEKVFELDFLTTEEGASLIQPLMSQGAPIAFAKSHLILVTDALVNLQRIERLLPILDKPARLRSEMLFYELQNIGAEDVVRRIQQMVQGPLKAQLENNTTVEGDKRTNQVIVFTHPTNKALIDNLIDRLDIDIAPTTSTKVYSIRYADATELVNIIEQVITGQRQVRQETGGTDASSQAALAARQRAAQIRESNQATASARADASNLQFSDFLTIVPDERANTIVASGTHSDLRYLEQLIDEIDTLLAQVRIEVVIAEVTLRDEDTRGIDTFGFSYSGTGFDLNLDGTDSEWTATPGNLYGVTFPGGIQWGPNEAFSWEFLLNAIAQKSNAKVLSAPTIVTTHNKEALVSVGREQPVITGTTTSDLSSGLSTREQVQYRDIKLELKVTPLIGIDGIVQMEIEQQNQSIIGEVSVNQNPQPIIGTRSANSYVSVRDGGLIALGGLQELTSTDTRSRMAVLGKIPVLGDLFSRTTNETNRTELLIFIRPTIIRSADDADTDANELIDALEGTREIRDYLDQGTFRPRPDPEEPDGELPRRFKP